MPSARKIFAIGDVHGCARELAELLAMLPIEPDSTAVFLGDYLDRGPDSKGVIDLILDLRKRCQVIALKGNHEDMALEFLDRPDSIGAALFILNGGSATLASYSDGQGGYAIPESHRAFLRELRLCWESENHFFVHAGVPDAPLKELDPEAEAELMLWIRAPFLRNQRRWEKIVVHGHTPVEAPEIKPNRINLDTGCVYGNRLTAMDVNSNALWSVPRVKEAEDADKPRYLQVPGGTRVAKRFAGVAPVFLERGGFVLEFETLNYNEFGLLIQEKQSGGASLSVGESVQGWIGAPGTEASARLARSASRVEFAGTVVRSESRDDLVLYGVKMERTRSDVDGVDYGAGRGLPGPGRRA